MAEVAGGDEAGLVQGGAVGGALCDLGGEGCLEGARVGRGRLGLALVLLGVLTQGALGGVEGVRLGGEVLDELGLVEELGVEARLGGRVSRSRSKAGEAEGRARWASERAAPISARARQAVDSSEGFWWRWTATWSRR